MSWSAKIFWNNHSWPSSESIGNRGGIVPTKSGAAKDPAEVKHESTVWLFRDVLTFSDILIGIDFVRCKMWPSQAVALDLLQSRKSMTESGGLPEVQFETTVWLFRGSPLTFTEVNILLISCCPQHWLSPMSWSALTLLEVRCDLLKQSLFDFLQSQSRIGRNQAERTNEIRRFAWQQRVAFSRCLDLHRCQLGRIVLSLALMLSDVWSALTLSEERCASLSCNWSIRTSFLRLLVGLFRQLNVLKKHVLPYLHPICEM